MGGLQLVRSKTNGVDDDTKYCMQCHIVCSVIVVNLFVTLSMEKFTNTIISSSQLNFQFIQMPITETNLDTICILTKM